MEADPVRVPRPMPRLLAEDVPAFVPDAQQPEAQPVAAAAGEHANAGDHLQQRIAVAAVGAQRAADRADGRGG